MNKSEIKAIVEGSPSSIFTRVDVLAIIDKLDERGAHGGSFKDAIEDVIGAINEVEDVNTSDCEVVLSLDGREITVEEVNVNNLDEAIRSLRDSVRVLRELLAGTP